MFYRVFLHLNFLEESRKAGDPVKKDYLKL